MSEVNQTTPSPTALLKQEVTDRLAAASLEVRTRVLNSLVEEELVKRATNLRSALEKRSSFQKEVDKIRPDMSKQSYDIEGKPVGSPVFTKDQIDKRKKLLENLNKINGSIDAALDESNLDVKKWENLANVVNLKLEESKTEEK